jgi:hypothetical protein
MGKTRAEQAQIIQYAPTRRMNRQSTALTKGMRKMLGNEQRKMMAIAIKTKLANAGVDGMGQIERTMVEEFADTLEHNEDIWNSFQGREFSPYMKAFLKDVILQTGGIYQTLYDIASEGITDIVSGSVYVEEEPESWWQRMFGGG